MTESKTKPIPRVTTGIPGLDTVLHGGIPRGGVYVVVGPPGAGKTIFGNQMCFHRVKSGGNALYVTLLAESHDRMLGNLQAFSFFDTSFIPEHLSYLSGAQVMEKGKLPALLDMLRQEIRRGGVELLILDGFMGIGESSETDLEVKRMVHELQAFGSMVGCTTVILTVPQSVPSRLHAGQTMVDGLIELTDLQIGPRALRELQVRKLRGSNFLRGKHTFDISLCGLSVFPRTEVLFANPIEIESENRVRQKFGIGELDRMLDGGVLSGSMTTIWGAPGTGKTLVGLSFLCAGANQNEKGIYFGFYEPPARLVDKAGRVGLRVEHFRDQGLLDIIWQPPLEHLLDGLAQRLLDAISKTKARRVFIDGLQGFKSATVYPDRIGAFLSALTNELRGRGVTAVFSEETDFFRNEMSMLVKDLAAVIENVVFLSYEAASSKLRRMISILKVRESVYDSTIRQLQITDSGLHVGDIAAQASFSY